MILNLIQQDSDMAQPVGWAAAMFGVLQPHQPVNAVDATNSMAPPLPNSLAPMPPTNFASRDELLVGAKAWAASQGFAVVIARILR